VGEPSGASWPDAGSALDLLPAGREVKAPELLFRKIEGEQVEAWRARFGGPEAD
jgi:methionyl-tRNA synthetase